MRITFNIRVLFEKPAIRLFQSSSRLISHFLVLLLMMLYFTPTVASNKYEYFESQLGLSYFKELTLGQYVNNNDKRIRKWVDDINVYVNGDLPPVLSSELNSVITEVDQIITVLQIKRVTSEDEANFFMFFGSGESYLDFEPDVRNKTALEDGMGSFTHMSKGSEIESVSIYYNWALVEDDVISKYILRKLFTHALGIPYQSPKYWDSIFAKHPFADVVNEYSSFDKVIISKLYSECVKAGMGKFELDYVLLNGCRL